LPEIIELLRAPGKEDEEGFPKGFRRRPAEALTHFSADLSLSEPNSPQSLYMKIELRLYASLGRYLPEKKEGNSCIVEVEPGTTIRELFLRFRIPPEERKIIFLNGIHAQGDEVLKEGDRVGAFPPVAGG
jgi:molybdopterin synthase sulfur carrier subunit